MLLTESKEDVCDEGGLAAAVLVLFLSWGFSFYSFFDSSLFIYITLMQQIAEKVVSWESFSSVYYLLSGRAVLCDSVIGSKLVRYLV